MRILGDLGENQAVTFRARAPHPGTAPASTAGRPLWIQADGEQLGARTSPAHCIQLWPLSARDSQHELGGSWGIRARGSPHLAGGTRNHELGSSGRLRVRTLPSKPVCLPARPPARPPPSRPGPHLGDVPAAAPGRPASARSGSAIERNVSPDAVHREPVGLRVVRGPQLARRRTEMLAREDKPGQGVSALCARKTLSHPPNRRGPGPGAGVGVHPPTTPFLPPPPPLPISLIPVSAGRPGP